MKTIAPMLSLLLVLAGFTAATGCNRRVIPQGAVVLHDTITNTITVTERYKEEIIVKDSSSITALLECDSLGNVYLREIEQMQGEMSQMEFNLLDNVLNIPAYSLAARESSQVSRDSIRVIREEVPVPYPVKETVNELTRLQVMQIKAGRAAMLALCALLAWMFLGGKIKNIISIILKR